MSTDSPNEYRDARSLSAWTLRLLYLLFAVTCAAAVSDWHEMGLIQEIRAGRFDSQDEMLAAASAFDDRAWIVWIAWLVTYILCAVFVLRWIHRAAHNASVRERIVKYGPASAVFWYFIPIAHFWKPFAAMKEIWENTATQLGRDAEENAVLLGTWWTLWVADGVLTYVAVRTRDGLLSAQLSLGSDLLELPLIIVFVVMIKRLMQMQEKLPELPPVVEEVPSIPGQGW